MVGTVRLVAPEEFGAATSSLSPREMFSDTYLYVAGWCRLDPRWHKIEDYAKFYESPAVHKGLQTLAHYHLPLLAMSLSTINVFVFGLPM